jgi:hypothetical protein
MPLGIYFLVVSIQMGHTIFIIGSFCFIGFSFLLSLIAFCVTESKPFYKQKIYYNYIKLHKLPSESTIQVKREQDDVSIYLLNDIITFH